MKDPFQADPNKNNPWATAFQLKKRGRKKTEISAA
jgi:hypothetical protein